MRVSVILQETSYSTRTVLRPKLAAVYHLRENHTVTLFELRVKSRYQLREWPLGKLADNHQVTDG